jgi:hypothetical protein
MAYDRFSPALVAVAREPDPSYRLPIAIFPAANGNR